MGRAAGQSDRGVRAAYEGEFYRGCVVLLQQIYAARNILGRRQGS